MDPETDLVSMSIHVTGWFDTGRTSLTVRVGRSHYCSTAQPNARITDIEDLYVAQAEIFLDEMADSQITAYVIKGLDTYITALQLP